MEFVRSSMQEFQKFRILGDEVKGGYRLVLKGKLWDSCARA